MTEIPLQNNPAQTELWPSEFLGFTMMQNRLAVPAWSYAFEVLRPSTVVELGTHEGGMSILLAIACRNYGARFVTFDRGLYNPRWAWWFDTLKVDFRRREDFLLTNSLNEIEALIQSPGIAFLVCDGNDKPHEFKICAQFLKPGDLIAAHDFMDPGTDYWRSCEITSAHIEQVCKDWNLETWNHDIFEKAAWLVRRKR